MAASEASLFTRAKHAFRRSPRQRPLWPTPRLTPCSPVLGPWRQMWWREAKLATPLGWGLCPLVQVERGALQTLRVRTKREEHEGWNPSRQNPCLALSQSQFLFQRQRKRQDTESRVFFRSRTQGSIRGKTNKDPRDTRHHHFHGPGEPFPDIDRSVRGLPPCPHPTPPLQILRFCWANVIASTELSHVDYLQACAPSPVCLWPVCANKGCWPSFPASTMPQGRTVRDSVNWL